MENSRQQERRDVSDIRFLVASFRPSGGDPVEMNIVDATASGLAAVAARPNQLQLAEGERVQIEIGLGSRFDPLVVMATVRSSSTVEGLQRYGVQFDQDSDLPEQLPSNSLRRVFNRRVSHRVQLASNEQVSIELHSPGGEEIQGRVLDISASGVGVEIALTDAALLGDECRVGVKFWLPGSPLVLRLETRVAGVRPIGAVALLGIEIDPDATTMFCFKRDAILDFVSRRVLGVHAGQSHS